MNRTIRCISLWQPWCSLLCLGAKHFETRSWLPPANAFGMMAIHAAKKQTKDLAALCETEPFKSTLARFCFDSFYDLPFGEIVGIGRYVTGFSTQSPRVIEYLSEHPDEEKFGDFGQGRFAWEFDNSEHFSSPIPCKGRQGFFFVDHQACMDALTETQESRVL